MFSSSMSVRIFRLNTVQLFADIYDVTWNIALKFVLMNIDKIILSAIWEEPGQVLVSMIRSLSVRRYMLLCTLGLQAGSKPRAANANAFVACI